MSNLGQLGFVLGTTGKQRFFEGLRRGAKGLVAGLALAATASGAWAGTGDKSISVSVTRLPDAVSYSVTSLGQSTFAAYRVTVKSLAKSGASNVWFKGKATTATFKQVAPDLCDADAGDNTAVTCELGGFVQGQSKEFVLVFSVPNAPAGAGQACTLPANLGNECIEFNWRIANGQGTANSQPSESQFSQNVLVETKVSVADTTGDSSSVQSYILVNDVPGQTTETGFLSTQLADGKAKTTAKVPKSAPVFIEQKETSATMGSCQNIYVLCFTSQLLIQEGGVTIQFGNDQVTGLLVTLFRGVSTLKNANTSIDKAILRYSENGLPGTFTDIQACNLDLSNKPVLPPGQVNCIVSRAVVLVGLTTYWQFDLIGSHNGFREF